MGRRPVRGIADLQTAESHLLRFPALPVSRKSRLGYVVQYSIGATNSVSPWSYGIVLTCVFQF